MIREHRSRSKLEAYYEKFTLEGKLDPNVHPWVAASWERCLTRGVGREHMDVSHRVPQEEFAAMQEQHGAAIRYLSRLCSGLREFFQEYNLSLLLLDSSLVVLKSYSLPFYQLTPGEIEGARVGEAEVGTSSVCVAREHQAPFWMFGPEMWVKECQLGDACSAPVFVAGELRYIVTLVSMEQVPMPQDAVISLLFTMRTALEEHLSSLQKIAAEEAILDAAPFAVYHVMPGGEVAYTNELGKKRLRGIGAKHDQETERISSNLNDVILNYQHTPITKGFRGIPSYNREVTWITPVKTYEDITTVVPLSRDEKQEVSSVAVISMPIEDLRTLVAHAAGYTAKYTLGSMVGDGATFTAVRQKAERVAKNRHHVLLQGETGTGKQRMAHGIHQASSRAAGPLISLRCGDATPEILEEELFGVRRSADVSHQGRLELASGGTLFLDEIEKMPKGTAHRLAVALFKGRAVRLGDDVERPIDVRIIAACDSDLKRLTERGLFDELFYELVSKSVIRVPPLRSRREDIPALATHIIGELAAQHQLAPKKIAQETIDKLCLYEWPGNIKQLQSVIEYAFFNTDGDEIKEGDISLMGDVRQGSEWKEDKDVFLRAWKAAGGNVSRLAGLLGVSRVTLYRYLKKYKLETRK